MGFSTQESENEMKIYMITCLQTGEMQQIIFCDHCYHRSFDPLMTAFRALCRDSQMRVRLSARSARPADGDLSCSQDSATQLQKVRTK